MRHTYATLTAKQTARDVFTALRKPRYVTCKVRRMDGLQLWTHFYLHIYLTGIFSPLLFSITHGAHASAAADVLDPEEPEANWTLCPTFKSGSPRVKLGNRVPPRPDGTRWDTCCRMTSPQTSQRLRPSRRAPSPSRTLPAPLCSPSLRSRRPCGSRCAGRGGSVW